MIIGHFRNESEKKEYYNYYTLSTYLFGERIIQKSSFICKKANIFIFTKLVV